MGDVTRDADGAGTVLIRRSKTDQEGAGRVAFVSADTLRRLDLWIAAAKITAGPLFVPLGNARKADRLRDTDVARIFRRRARAAGIAPEAIGGHSTRVGAAQDHGGAQSRHGRDPAGRRLEIAANARSVRRAA